MTTTSVALLRGINVGGNRKLPMKDLSGWMERAGFEGVRTYIQSGNVVFSHGARPEEELRTELEALIASRAGFDVPVMVRPASELAAVVDANPFPGVEPTRLHVGFLTEPPDPAAVAAVDPATWAPEEFVVIGREIYLHLPDGMGRAQLPPRLKILAPATARNWRTVTALLELTGS